jgi:ATP-binding cassette, subfamily F, member 3
MLYRFQNVKKSYGPHDILREVTWQHNPGERVGLVGRNGAGKTTLFRILLGKEDPDGGQIFRTSGLTIGHVGQHLDSAPTVPLFDFVLAAFADVLRIERKMREIEEALSSPDGDHEKLLDKYAELQHDYEHANGYGLHNEVERVLTGLGFDADSWSRPIGQFSGGQQNRAMLARVLLSQVDLMLLDEPTNHLDLQGTEFLEEFLQSYKGSYLLVSHDRTFLNRTVTRIVELAHGRLIEYPGSYDRFVELRAERHEQLRAEYERQRDYIEKTEDFIRRNIAGQKTKQAQSRRKQLSRIDQVERPQTDETLARFELDAGPRSGAVALEVRDLSAGYDGEAIVSGFDLTIRRGERYAIIGPNGSGKSTLLKTFAGRLLPLGGELAYGHNVQVAYYDQTLGDLSPKNRVIDEVWNLDHSQTEEAVRNYLARFSFREDDVFKAVSALSGGERGRLALAKIMYVGGNLLLLDEPTNHLDVYTREALEEALDQFTGALVVVSHDRYFIDRVAEQVIVVEDGVAEVHYGNYSELVEKFKREAGAVAAARSGRKEPKAAAPAPLDREDQKRREKRLRKVEEELGSLEGRIAVLEKQKEENDRLLCSEEIYRDGAKTREIQNANSTIARQIEQLYERWEELTHERETLQVGVA